MNLKLVYETAYPFNEPFDDKKKNIGEFVYSLILCDTLDNLMDNSNEITFIGLYLYLLKKNAKKDLDFLENMLIKKYDSPDYNSLLLEQTLYMNFNSSSLFDSINKLKESSPNLAKLLYKNINKFNDFKDFDSEYSQLLIALEESNNLKISKEKILNNFVDAVFNLPHPQHDYDTFVANYIKKEKIDVKEVKKVLTELIENTSSSRVERAKNLMQKNPKTKMVNQTRIRVASQQENMTEKTGWQNVRALTGLVVGQEEATQKIADKIIGSFVGFKSDKEPVATFLLTGPTGVGKTETAKAVANLCCDGNIYVVDMTTFKHETDISRLLGASPGYVGYGDRNSFCDFLNEHPDGVVLFDEIEKAARGCLDLLMRILDEGEFIDARGRIISLRESVIFCTTNLTEYLEKDNKSVEEKMTSQEGLRKEIVGRFSEVIEYKKLSHECCRTIVERFIEGKLENFNKKNQGANITLSYTMELVDKIIDEANTDLLGARDLKKTIQKYFITPVSDYVIKNNPSNVCLIVTPDSIIESNKTQQGLIEDTKNLN